MRPDAKQDAGVADRIIDLRRVPAKELKEARLNWRIHPKRQREALRAILADVGYVAPLIAREEQGRLVLVDGHLRKSIDPDQIVPVVVLDVSEEEADRILATLDPITGLAQANGAVLRELLEGLSISNEALRQMLADVARGARRIGGDPDDIPPLPGRPTTRPGDLWTLASHRILCGDATSTKDLARLMGRRKARVLWTDPPWGNSYVGKTKRALRIQGDEAAGLESLLRGSFAAVDRFLQPGAAIYIAHPAGASQITFLEAFLTQGWVLSQQIVWVKDAFVLGHSDFHAQHEPILYGHTPSPGRWGRGHHGWYGGNAESTVLQIPRPKASREHPTMKPTELIRRLIENSSGFGDLILDPFLGSGSTLVAAEQCGRRCFATDIDPSYVDVAVRRWERVTGKKAKRQRRRNAD